MEILVVAVGRETRVRLAEGSDRGIIRDAGLWFPRVLLQGVRDGDVA